ncbi:cupredoxin domain-containing protein [Halomicrobium salinisoli]|uniref:cupredoxin domain-containing protein n=1 Tax=Halomicrobium salinisoli TaxID=2878391 RepID=UPI001CEFE71F|nr:plastocyanin/azurin family copper-binding protein [Halomicrobium salinisoli]
MSNDTEQTDDGRFAVDRRSMLALMGAGGASLALTGGVGSGAAQVDGDGGDGSADRCEACIDPYTGYLVPGDAAAGADAGGGAVGNETNGTTTDDAAGGAAANETDGESAVDATDGEADDNGSDDEADDGLPEPGFVDDEEADDSEGGTGGGAQAPGETEAFDPAVTITMNIGDADVVFPDDGAGGATDNETDAGLGDNGTDGGALGNETADDETDSALDDETDDGVADNESEGTLTDTTDEQAAAFTQQEQEGFPDFYFDPVGVRVSPGDVVAFQPQEGVHTVTAYDPRYYDLPERIPDGAAGLSSPPITGGDTWYYRFDETGVYDLFCLPHEQFGMVVRIVVAEEDGEVPEGYDVAEGADGEADGGLGNESEGNATDAGTAQDGDGVAASQAGVSDIALSVFQSPEMDPENIVEEGPIAWTELSEVESQPPAN